MFSALLHLKKRSSSAPQSDSDDMNALQLEELSISAYAQEIASSVSSTLQEISEMCTLQGNEVFKKPSLASASIQIPLMSQSIAWVDESITQLTGNHQGRRNSQEENTLRLAVQLKLHAIGTCFEGCCHVLSQFDEIYIELGNGKDHGKIDLVVKKIDELHGVMAELYYLSEHPLGFLQKDTVKLREQMEAMLFSVKDMLKKLERAFPAWWEVLPQLEDTLESTVGHEGLSQSLTNFMAVVRGGGDLKTHAKDLKAVVANLDQETEKQLGYSKAQVLAAIELRVQGGYYGFTAIGIYARLIQHQYQKLHAHNEAYQDINRQACDEYFATTAATVSPRSADAKKYIFRKAELETQELLALMLSLDVDLKKSKTEENRNSDLRTQIAGIAQGQYRLIQVRQLAAQRLDKEDLKAFLQVFGEHELASQVYLRRTCTSCIRQLESTRMPKLSLSSHWHELLLKLHHGFEQLDKNGVAKDTDMSEAVLTDLKKFGLDKFVQQLIGYMKGEDVDVVSLDLYFNILRDLPTPELGLEPSNEQAMRELRQQLSQTGLGAQVFKMMGNLQSGAVDLLYDDNTMYVNSGVFAFQLSKLLNVNLDAITSSTGEEATVADYVAQLADTMEPSIRTFAGSMLFHSHQIYKLRNNVSRCESMIGFEDVVLRQRYWTQQYQAFLAANKALEQAWQNVTQSSSAVNSPHFKLLKNLYQDFLSMSGNDLDVLHQFCFAAKLTEVKSNWVLLPSNSQQKRKKVSQYAKKFLFISRLGKTPCGQQVEKRDNNAVLNAELSVK